jgi:hypothetical protein
MRIALSSDHPGSDDGDANDDSQQPASPIAPAPPAAMTTMEAARFHRAHPLTSRPVVGRMTAGVAERYAARLEQLPAAFVPSINERLSDLDAATLSDLALVITAVEAGEAVAGSAHVSYDGEAPLAPVLLDDRGRPVSVGVLCYDEVQMMDVADATVLRGVLCALLDAGWLLVATCNRTPDQFAASAMHRQHPQARFSEAMRAHCDTRVLGTGQADYRTGLEAAAEPSFFFRDETCGLDSCPFARLDRCFDRLTDGAAAEEAAPIGAGRELRLLAGGGVARASFHRLCDAALGAGDYVALAQRYHTLCVDALPQMSLQQRDQVSGASERSFLG